MVGQNHGTPQTFLDDLLSREKIDTLGLNRAVALSRSSGERLAIVLSRIGLVSEVEIAQTFARIGGSAVAGADDLLTATTLDGRISAAFLQKEHLVPIGIDNGTLQVVMADPSDQFAISSIELATGLRLSVRPGLLSEIDAAILKLVTADSTNPAEPVEEVKSEDVSRLRDIASEAPVVRYVSNVLETAVRRRASDIHFETTRADLRVRLRVDGALLDIEPPPASMRAAIISRIKILAQLDIGEQRMPQDGRMTETIRGEDIDFRVATAPSLFGERAVLRVLDRKRVPLEFESLGFPPALLQSYLKLLEQPHGILLVTGPTGSGKTTTLYASLAHLNRPDVNILSVEDPVEYEMPGITQVNVRPDIGLSFASVLRAFLRQDPDILMVGEIRDVETGHIAVQASLTGHLVLSTLHTNDAASAITRLVEMGIEDYLLAATLNGVVAQRLVRKLCNSCSEPYAPDPDLLERISPTAKTWEGDYRRPTGCPNCNETGYLGRTSILEILPITDEIRQAILKRQDAGSLRVLARAHGMATLAEHGLALASRGITSIDELLRTAKV
ncbi:GspE/PulE family protein [Hyphomonas sp.]|uniref:GspE/PulE family protein n=1 Tax=Hyphomonas sp. TaxID=87 RepID=UPI0035285AA6